MNPSAAKAAFKRAQCTDGLKAVPFKAEEGGPSSVS